MAMSLGAVLYTPASNHLAARRVLDGHWPSVSFRPVLENAIANRDLFAGERNVRDLIDAVRAGAGRGVTRRGPVRVRADPGTTAHLVRLLKRWDRRVDEIGLLALNGVCGRRDSGLAMTSK